MEQSKNSGFNSKLGVILAAAGSAVGLGNIWKYTLVTNFMMSLGALAMSSFVGWFMPLQDKDLVPYSQKKYKILLRPLFVFSLRWIVPIAILLIFLNGLDVFNIG